MAKMAMGWSGSWAGDVYTGEYNFADGATFVGTAKVKTTHDLLHVWPTGGKELVQHPVEEAVEFTGTWVGPDGTAYSPVMPPAPER